MMDPCGQSHRPSYALRPVPVPDQKRLRPAWAEPFGLAQISPRRPILDYGGGVMLEGLTTENMVYLAALASVQYARGRSAEDIELLAAFFEVVGDNLSLLALSAPSGNSTGE